MGYKSIGASVPNVRWRSPMLAGVVLAVGLLGSAMFGDAGAQSDRLSQEIHSKVDQYIAVWNTHDSNVLGDQFTADADMIMGNGAILDGRNAVNDWWRDYFAVQEPERELTIELLSIRSIQAGVALLNVRTTTSGRTALGVELVARKARGTWVLVRQDDEWLISAMRGMPTEQDRIIRGGG
ncbi:YybH family protein [Gemmatimonadota bacterium]